MSFFRANDDEKKKASRGPKSFESEMSRKTALIPQFAMMGSERTKRDTHEEIGGFLLSASVGPEEQQSEGEESSEKRVDKQERRGKGREKMKSVERERLALFEKRRKTRCHIPLLLCFRSPSSRALHASPFREDGELDALLTSPTAIGT